MCIFYVNVSWHFSALLIVRFSCIPHSISLFHFLCITHDLLWNQTCLIHLDKLQLFVVINCQLTDISISLISPISSFLLLIRRYLFLIDYKPNKILKLQALRDSLVHISLSGEFNPLPLKLRAHPMFSHCIRGMLLSEFILHCVMTFCAHAGLSWPTC